MPENELARPPVIFVVGEVAGLAAELDWYERLPLFGRRIVVTRARRQAAALVERLERCGRRGHRVPDHRDRSLPIAREVFDAAGSYDWLVLTSVNGVDELLRAASRRRSRPPRAGRREDRRHRAGDARSGRGERPLRGGAAGRVSRRGAARSAWRRIAASASCWRAPKSHARSCPTRCANAARSWTWWRCIARGSRSGRAVRRRMAVRAPCRRCAAGRSTWRRSPARAP